jgi:hypothetical protein
MKKPYDPTNPEVGDECPSCESAALRAGHLIDAEQVETLKGKSGPRNRALADCAVVYCADCWSFWTVTN